MKAVSEALNAFLDWREPRDGVGDNPFRLACTLDQPAPKDEVRAAWLDRELPAEVSEMWSTCRQAQLFVDIDYGQWGLRLLSPAESAYRTASEQKGRPGDIQPDDIVAGEFLGDQELLILAPSEEGSRRVLIALPLDRRGDWHPAARSLGEFLQLYFAHVGDKYWERTELS